jgi:4-amino-4-deoxy-L-arabinose transferase-like glycosyltransferase
VSERGGGVASAGGRGRGWECAVVAAAFLALVTVAAIWLAIDRRPPEWDYANHLENALYCRRDLLAGDFGAVFARSSFYPPLVSCVAGLVYGVVPSDVVFGEVVMLAFLGLGMASTYVLGRRLAGGAGGVVAAVVFGTAPVVVHHALHFQLDVPLAGMVAAFLVVLLATDCFTRRGWAAATGILFGLGLLTKAPFFVFVAPACLLVLVSTRGRRSWLHAWLAGVATVLVALPWYGPRALGLATQFQNRSFKQAAEEGLPSVLSSASLAYYPSGFPAQFGLIATLLLLVGLAVALRRRGWFVLAGLAPFLVFVLLQNKKMRYALPLLPMMAVAGGLGFTALPRTGRWVAGVALGAAAVVQVSLTAFALPGVAATLPLIGTLTAGATPPSGARWPLRRILEAIAHDSGGAPVVVSVVANHPHFSAANFRYYAVRDGLGLRVARAWEIEPLGIQYMILKTGDLGPSWTIEKAEHVRERLASDAALARVFPVLGEFPLPDGSVASVRARRLPGDLDVTPDALAQSMADGLRARLGEVMRDVEGLDVRLDYDRGILGGHVKRLWIAAAAATVGELRRRQAAVLRLRDLRVVIDDALVNPWSAARGRRFDPLDAGRLTVERATITDADLQSFLARVRGVGRISLALGAGFTDLRFEIPGPDVAARVRFAVPSEGPFALVADRVTVGGVVVPALFVNWIMASFDPSRGLGRRLPFPVTVAPITVTPGSVRIGGA